MGVPLNERNNKKSLLILRVVPPICFMADYMGLFGFYFVWHMCGLWRIRRRWKLGGWGLELDSWRYVHEVDGFLYSSNAWMTMKGSVEFPFPHNSSISWLFTLFKCLNLSFIKRHATSDTNLLTKNVKASKLGKILLRAMIFASFGMK